MTRAVYIWRIERTTDWSWDEYDAAIVAARTEAEARLIHPGGINNKWDGNTWGKWGDHEWPVKPEDVAVTKLGKAAAGVEAGTVLLASFNAG